MSHRQMSPGHASVHRPAAQPIVGSDIGRKKRLVLAGADECFIFRGCPHLLCLNFLGSSSIFKLVFLFEGVFISKVILTFEDEFGMF